MSLSEVLVPSIGLCFTACLFSSSVPGSWRTRKTGVLAQDPTPSVTTLINTILWVIYAAMTRDPWVYVGNLFGVICNSFNTAVALRYGKEEIRTRIDLIFCGGLTFLSVVIMVLASPTFIEDEDLRLSIMSGLCIGICMIMFASPLFQGLEALRYNDSSRINFALSLAQMGNGFMWTSYGLSKGDVTLILPNGSAIVLAGLNLLIKILLVLRHNKKSIHSTTKHAAAEAASWASKSSLSHVLLVDAIANGTPVHLRSLWFNGMLHVEQKDDSQTSDIDLEEQQQQQQQQQQHSELSYVRGAATSASAIQLVPLGQDEVGLRTPDGRFLELQTTASPHAGSSKFQPSDIFVVARHCERPSQNGHFVIVHAPAREQDTTTGRMLERDFGQDSVSFFNPALGLFLRCNEQGFFDSSPRWCNDVKSEGWRLPVGWLWERFAVELADPVVVSAAPETSQTLEVAVSSQIVVSESRSAAAAAAVAAATAATATAAGGEVDSKDVILRL